ncbi:MAG: fibrobacter succinogenes major paralogous domain-containing protein [Fibromonadales bacterium]|nr:fibrobacter succinogenes major paralogous domain-containing protein [Fibromonadales bacterium]
MVLRFFILAVAFLLSCTSIERDSVCDEKSVNYNGCVGGGKGNNISSYKTVKIGSQTWMAENLNYAAPGSKCGGNDKELKDKNTSICDTYGRLYNWATAMDLPANCNFNSCAIGAKHRGICPIGWHIPSDDDWNTLIKIVNPSCSDNEDCDGAGTDLKATSGWTSSNGVPSGSNKHGFSALPGGFGYSDNNFSSVGNDGNWWSSSEFSSDYAYSRRMNYYNKTVNYSNGEKSYFFSVRCVQD